MKKTIILLVSFLFVFLLSSNVFSQNEIFKLWKLDKPIVLQVNAFESEKEAQKVYQKLFEAGHYTTFIAESQVDGKKIFRVRIGMFDSLKEAKNTGETLKNEGLIKDYFPTLDWETYVISNGKALSAYDVLHDIIPNSRKAINKILEDEAYIKEKQNDTRLKNTGLVVINNKNPFWLGENIRLSGGDMTFIIKSIIGNLDDELDNELIAELYLFAPNNIISVKHLLVVLKNSGYGRVELVDAVSLGEIFKEDSQDEQSFYVELTFDLPATIKVISNFWRIGIGKQREKIYRLNNGKLELIQ